MDTSLIIFLFFIYTVSFFIASVISGLKKIRKYMASEPKTEQDFIKQRYSQCLRWLIMNCPIFLKEFLTPVQETPYPVFETFFKSFCKPILQKGGVPALIARFIDDMKVDIKLLKEHDIITLANHIEAFNEFIK